MLVEEISNVVDEAGDDDKRTLDGLILNCVRVSLNKPGNSKISTYSSPS